MRRSNDFGYFSVVHMSRDSQHQGGGRAVVLCYYYIAVRLRPFLQWLGVTRASHLPDPWRAFDILCCLNYASLTRNRIVSYAARKQTPTTVRVCT